MSEHKEPIPSMIYNSAVGGHVTTSQQIIDENENKEQSQINAEIKQTLGQGGSIDNRINQAKNDIIGGASSNGNTLKKIEDRVSPLELVVGSGGSIDDRIAKEGARHYLKNETYTKEEVNAMITTPDQNFVSVESTVHTTAVTDVLPTTGEANTIYRVANWNGSQYNINCYSEYTWNTSTSSYIKLSTKNVGIDDEPIAGSEDLVKSGGIFDKLVGTVKFVGGTQDAWNILTGFIKDIYVIGADTSKTVSISYVYKNTEGNEGKFCLQFAYFIPNNNTELRKNFYVLGSTAGNALIQMTDEIGNSGIEVFIRTQNSPIFDSTSFIQATDFYILKTGFGENVIPFVIDYIEKYKKKSMVVDANNYSTILPDLNNAEEGVVYRFLFSTIETSLPAHLPSSVWGNNGLASCIRFGSSTYSTQFLVTQACIYYRILSTEWNDWETLTPIKEVTVGTGGNFSSLISALKYTSDKTPIRILRNTVIDVEQEYISEYGVDFWTNYDNYDNHPNDMMYRGIWLGKGRELYGEENATIVFNYSGNNQNVKEHFSLLAVAGDNYVHDLTLYPSNNCEYHIHDDWQTGTMESTQIKYERLIFKGSSYSTICIGAGIGNNCSYIIKDCIFLCNEAANYNISYHGCTSGNENAKGRIYVTGCYGLGQLVFRSYGVSTQLTDCIVSNCKFSKIDCFINPGQVNENMKLIAFNNTETGVS